MTDSSYSVWLHGKNGRAVCLVAGFPYALAANVARALIEECGVVNPWIEKD